jgi:hypothetical protein
MVLKYNLNPSKSACPICGVAWQKVIDCWMGSGIGIFAEGTDQLICWDCVQDRSPLLARLILLSSAALSAKANSNEVMTLAANYRQALHHAWEVDHTVWEIEGE